MAATQYRKKDLKNKQTNKNKTKQQQQKKTAAFPGGLAVKDLTLSLL